MHAVQVEEPLGQGQVNKDNLRTSQTLQVDVKDLLAGEANRLVFAGNNPDPGSGSYIQRRHKAWLR